MSRLSDSTLLRYFVFGAMAATLQVAALTAFVEVFGIGKIIASTAAFYIAVLVNYFLQRRFTFRSHDSHLSALPKFVGVSTIGAGLNLLVFYLLSMIIHYVLAQCVALLVVFAFNYGLSKLFIFRHRDRQRGTGQD